MAIVKNNLITRGLSGTVGGALTFKQVHNRTVAARKRGPNKNPPKAGEQAGRDRFKAAAAWYRQVVKPDRALLAAYAAAVQSPFHTAYNMAIADFMTGPEINAVDAAGYRGRPGDLILIQAADNFKVTAVQVSIYGADGTLLEVGPAEAIGSEWQYPVSVPNPDWPGSRLAVQAFDLPGNHAAATLML